MWDSNRKKQKTFILLSLSIIALLIVFLISLIALKNKLSKNDRNRLKENKAKTEVANNDTVKTRLVKSGMSTVFSTAAGKDVDVDKYIEENMSDEDAHFINEMLQEKVDGDMILQLAKAFVADGDVSKKSLKELTKKLTPEEKERLEELYEQYGDDFLNYIEGN